MEGLIFGIFKVCLKIYPFALEQHDLHNKAGRVVSKQV